jgi:hypothetical protein
MIPHVGEEGLGVPLISNVCEGCHLGNDDSFFLFFVEAIFDVVVDIGLEGSLGIVIVV